MKPPLFIECAVCGREFGSKSIQIHEPQCLQKLRRTEIAQQESESATPPTTSNTKKTRRKKKTSERNNNKLGVANSSLSDSGSNRVPAAPTATKIFSHTTLNSAPSFVIMATTTSTSNFAAIERLNLPKIQTSSNGSGARPSTAVLDKPRILNPEYIQYDMSLTRIDFTGQKKSSVMDDENRNNKIQRQNTQILETPSRRHGLALPTVADGNFTVVGHHQKHYHHQQGRVYRSSDQSKLLPSANIMTTVDSILGDPQRKVRGAGASNMGFPIQSGKFWDDAPHHQHNTHTLMSLWSQELYLMNALSSQLPDSQVPMLPPIHDLISPTSTTNTHNPLDESADPSSTPPPHPTPPIESLFASPNFPFFGKLSHCDLEKPLRTCFHLEKMPGHRNEFESHQDNFVTPSASSEFPQLQQQPAAGALSSPNNKNDNEQQAATDIIRVEHVETRKSGSEAILQYPPQKRSNSNASQLQEKSSQESLIKFDSICNELGNPTQEKRKQSEEVVVLKDIRNPVLSNSQQALALADLSSFSTVQQGRETVTKNWIGEPFMQQHVYYSAPFIKERETDTESESYYATPMGESQDEHEAVDQLQQHPAIFNAIQNLKDFIDSKSTGRLQVSESLERATYSMLPAMPALFTEEHYSEIKSELFSNLKDLAHAETQEVEATTAVNLVDFAQEIVTSEYSSTPEGTEEVETLGTGTHSDNGCSQEDGFVSSLHEGSQNSIQTVISRSSCNGSKAMSNRLKSLVGYLPRSEIPGSDADDESCEPGSPDVPDRTCRMRSKTLISRRFNSVRRKGSRRETTTVVKVLKPRTETAAMSSNQCDTHETGDLKDDTQIAENDTELPLSEVSQINSDLFRFKMSAVDEEEFPQNDSDFENMMSQKLFARTAKRQPSAQCGTSKDSGNEESIPVEQQNAESPSRNRVYHSPIKEKTDLPTITYSEATEFSSTVHESSQEDLHSRSAQNGDESRRRLPILTKPKTTNGIDCVTVWEGANVTNPSGRLDGEVRPSPGGEDNAFSDALPSRPPTRRRLSPTTSAEREPRMRSQGSSTSTSAKTDSTQRSKKVRSSKIQSLISNVTRVGELLREKTKIGTSETLSETHRPQTSPRINNQTQRSSMYRDRPSTSLPMSRDSNYQLRKNKASSARGKPTVPRSKRSISQSATTRSGATSSGKQQSSSGRPLTATAIKFTTSGSRPRSMTVRTTLLENDYPPEIFNTLSPGIPSSSQKSCDSPSPYAAEDEPLELLFTFKSKPPKRKPPSPSGLASPQEVSLDKTSLYKQIELHRRHALAEAQKLIDKRRSMLRKTYKDSSGTSSTTPSSPVSPVSTPRREPSPKTVRSAKQSPTKLIIGELKKQVRESKEAEYSKKPRVPTGYYRAPNPRPPSAAKQQKKTVPLPMSKRVHFSSPIQSKVSRFKVPIKSSKQFKTAKVQTSSVKNVPTDNTKHYTISFATSPNSKGKVRVTYRKSSNGNEQETQDQDQEGEGEPDGDNDTTNQGSASQAPSNTHQQGLSLPPDEPKSSRDNESAEANLQKLEEMNDKIRGKEFDRRRRGKDGGRKETAYSTVTLYVPPVKENDKMLDVKIIVRRKNKDGSYPNVDDAVGSFSSKYTYLVVDEEPLTCTSPNPYMTPHMNRAKPAGDNALPLKITTSDQSTVNSLPSEEALNRFLTCYVCGQTLNVKEFFSHEKKCLADVNKKNEYLADEDKKVLPPKPQGTITIKHWNDFAHDATKHKFIRCPFCEMEFFPDRPEDVEAHKENCTNRPLPTPPAPKGIKMDEEYTVQMAEESQGWIIPSAKEMRRNNWNPGTGRVEEYTRPAPHRLKKYKKPKAQPSESEPKISLKKKINRKSFAREYNPLFK